MASPTLVSTVPLLVPVAATNPAGVSTGIVSVTKTYVEGHLPDGSAFTLSTFGVVGTPSVSSSLTSSTSALSSTALTSTPSSSLLSSTLSSSGSTSASSSSMPSSTTSASASASSTASSSSSNGSSSNTGLDAGIGVLAALLAIALIAIAFLLFRRRRKMATPPSHITEMDALEGGRTTRASEKDNLLRDAQASLAANSGPGVAILDDRSVNNKFARLNQDINDWVMSHFKNSNPPTTVSTESRQAVSQQPNYATLLQDPRGKFLLLRGVVADYLYEAFHTGDINGLGETMRMKNHLPENVPFREQSLWRSNTVSLMSKDAGFSEKQAAAVQTVTQRIDAATASLAGLPHSDSRLRGLARVVQTAADIALELAKQRVDFYLFAPRESTFDPTKMDDVTQEMSGDKLGGTHVLSVVFPAVLRHGDNSGSEFSEVKVISKALVLVNHEPKAI